VNTQYPKINKKTNIVFFTGAGMSAESGIPTYRGSGGIWHNYNWKEYACQEAFNIDPQKVINFHNIRREKVATCVPNTGHVTIADLQDKFENITIITQNIDGLHQLAGSRSIIELHGSLWWGRCEKCNFNINLRDNFIENQHCPKCNTWLRPNITWFGDALDVAVFQEAHDAILNSEVFISIGTSGIVHPAAEFPYLAKSNGAYCIEVNLETTRLSSIYDSVQIGSAGTILKELQDAFFDRIIT
jgi:NAD-dependent deacetylase